MIAGTVRARLLLTFSQDGRERRTQEALSMASKRWNLGFFLSLALLTVAVAGCGSASGVQSKDGVFKILNKAPARIVLEVNPATLPADGASTALVMARVYNDEGYLVSADVQVSFSLRLGVGTDEPGSGRIYLFCPCHCRNRGSDGGRRLWRLLHARCAGQGKSAGLPSHC